MTDSRPIGVFDSGLGGLTVVKALQALLPNESIIYFGDTARVPYGNKSKDLVIQYSLEIAEFLLKNDAKMIVIACNTASALALETLQNKFSIPVLGVIIPGAREAIKATESKHIGIIGTLATINSEAYQKELIKCNPDITIFAQPCPLFVPLVEEGWLDGEVVEKVASHYLDIFTQRKMDTLILGCTHYPLLKDTIAKVVHQRMVLIDSGEAVAKDVEKTLSAYNILNGSSSKGKLVCFVTDIPIRFEKVGERFLGGHLGQVKTVHAF